MSSFFFPDDPAFDSDMLHNNQKTGNRLFLWMGYFVYILQSQKDSRFYYGQTQNLEKRLLRHNQGKSSYTKKYLPWKLFAYKPCDSRSEAMKYEKMLKNLHSENKMREFINRHQFVVPDRHPPQSEGSQEVIGPEK